MTETAISIESARKILTSVNQLEDFDPMADYYVRRENGKETLWQGGLDSPLAQNNTCNCWKY